MSAICFQSIFTIRTIYSSMITILVTEIQTKTEGSRNFARWMTVFTRLAMAHSHMLRLITTAILCPTMHKYTLYTCY